MRFLNRSLKYFPLPRTSLVRFAEANLHIRKFLSSDFFLFSLAPRYGRKKMNLKSQSRDLIRPFSLFFYGTINKLHQTRISNRFANHVKLRN